LAAGDLVWFRGDTGDALCGQEGRNAGQGQENDDGGAGREPGEDTVAQARDGLAVSFRGVVSFRAGGHYFLHFLFGD
jgi:hypothetical protein